MKWPWFLNPTPGVNVGSHSPRKKGAYNLRSRGSGLASADRHLGIQRLTIKLSHSAVKRSELPPVNAP